MRARGHDVRLCPAHLFVFLLPRGSCSSGSFRTSVSLPPTDDDSSSFVPLVPYQVRRALGGSAIEENEQLMMEAEALAEIIGEVRHRTDASASARRLYENPGRTMVEGELRLLVQSIKRCASGDFAEVSGRGGVPGRGTSSAGSARGAGLGWTPGEGSSSCGASATP